MIRLLIRWCMFFSTNILKLMYFFHFLQSQIRLENSLYGSEMRPHCWYCGSHHIQPAFIPITKSQLSRQMRWKVCCMLKRKANRPVQHKLHSKGWCPVERTTFPCKRCPKMRYRCRQQHNIAQCRWSRPMWHSITIRRRRMVFVSCGKHRRVWANSISIKCQYRRRDANKLFHELVTVLHGWNSRTIWSRAERIKWLWKRFRAKWHRGRQRLMWRWNRCRCRICRRRAMRELDWWQSHGNRTLRAIRKNIESVTMRWKHSTVIQAQWPPIKRVMCWNRCCPVATIHWLCRPFRSEWNRMRPQSTLWRVRRRQLSKIGNQLRKVWTSAGRATWIRDKTNTKWCIRETTPAKWKPFGRLSPDWSSRICSQGPAMK